MRAQVACIAGLGTSVLYDPAAGPARVENIPVDQQAREWLDPSTGKALDSARKRNMFLAVGALTVTGLWLAFRR